jgi:hypothetical protein
MKIRITQNTLRIRLSENDLQELSDQKTVGVSLPMVTIDFAIQLQVQQSYIHQFGNKKESKNQHIEVEENQIDKKPQDPNEFESTESNEIDVFYDREILCISIASNTLQPWIDSRETSLKNSITYPNNRTLHLIVEKDFLG